MRLMHSAVQVGAKNGPLAIKSQIDAKYFITTLRYGGVFNDL